MLTKFTFQLNGKDLSFRRTTLNDIKEVQRIIETSAFSKAENLMADNSSDMWKQVESEWEKFFVRVVDVETMPEECRLGVLTPTEVAELRENFFLRQFVRSE